jgi:hypothetical protein
MSKRSNDRTDYGHKEGWQKPTRLFEMSSFSGERDVFIYEYVQNFPILFQFVHLAGRESYVLMKRVFCAFANGFELGFAGCMDELFSLHGARVLIASQSQKGFVYGYAGRHPDMSTALFVLNA